MTSPRSTADSSASSTPSDSVSTSNSGSLTHIDAAGEAQMVDVSGKEQTVRRAIAAGQIRMQLTTLEAIQSGNAPKGDVLGTARLAGIMAAKQTPQLIPLCHAIPIHKVTVTITPDDELPGFKIQAEVKTKAETGVEMEALTAVSVAALTLYDMAKGLEKSMQIEAIHLVSKTGGKSGVYSSAQS
ncbi:MAG: cyclic pyranopterin monophosphate synthase MoaC [Cyanobacteria bacterium J06627_8]